MSISRRASDPRPRRAPVAGSRRKVVRPSSRRPPKSSSESGSRPRALIAGAQADLHGLQGQGRGLELVETQEALFGQGTVGGRGDGLVADGDVGGEADEEGLRSGILDVRAGDRDPAFGREHVAGLAEPERYAERALELHPGLLGDAGLGVERVERPKAEARVRPQVERGRGERSRRTGDVDGADRRHVRADRQPFDGARAGVVAAAGRKGKRVPAPGDIDRLPEGFAMAEGESTRERNGRRGGGPGGLERDDRIETFAGDGEGRIVEPGPGEGEGAGSGPAGPRPRRPAGGEGKVGRAGDIPAGERRRNERRGQAAQGGDVEAAAFDPEFHRAAPAEAIAAREPERREAGEGGIEPGQRENPGIQVEPPGGRDVGDP